MLRLSCIAWMTLQCLLLFSSSKSATWLPPADLPLVLPAPGADHAGQGQGTSQEDFTIRTNAVLVTVDAVVRNEKSGFVGDLLAEDFEIYDNGVSQRLTYFSHDQLPLAVALVVDRSRSVQPYLPQLRSAALAALQHLKPEDEVALFSFDVKPYQFTELTKDREEIARMIGKIPGGTATDICDALFEAAQYLRVEAPDRRRAIILVSDNYQSVPSAHSFSDTTRQLLEGAVTLYGIRTFGDNPAINIKIDGYSIDQQGLNNPHSIAKIAGETGGEILDASAPERLPEALDATISNLKTGYILGFTPSDEGNEGRYHRLTVRLKAGQRCPGCRVQARSGYYAGAHAPSPSQNLPRRAGAPATPPKKPLADFEELVAQNRIIEARDDISQLADIPFEISASKVKDAQGKSRIKVDLLIDPSKVLFKIVDGRHTARLRITTFYSDAAGNSLGGNWQIMDMHFLEATYQHILQSGIPFSTTIPHQARTHLIKVVVYDPWSDKIGARLIATG